MCVTLSLCVVCTDALGQVKTYAFSGGQQTKEEHQRLGGNCETDISYQWLTFFLHDDAKLQHIHDEYSSGRMLSGEIKKELIDVRAASPATVCTRQPVPPAAHSLAAAAAPYGR